MLIPVRRIVTQNDENGQSFALIDGKADNVLGTLTELWTTGPAPHDHEAFDDHGATSRSLEPKENGTVFRFFQVAPEGEGSGRSPDDVEADWKKLFDNVNASHCRPNTERHPGMHTTSTTDYIILLSGHITLVLDKTELDLKPFDVVIQRGTNHAWVNRGNEDALLMAVLVDAKG